MVIRYVLITAARNEERHIGQTMRSVMAQTHRPLKWVIVNDGSTDRTGEVISRCAAESAWIERMDMPARRDRSFAAKATCFNAAVERVRDLEFDVIGNLDADITFEDDYLGFLIAKFGEDPKLGVAGTPFVENGYDSAKHSFEGVNHVAGGCQLFRRECLAEVGGYIPNRAGGVDWIAVTTARMKGWRTHSFVERRFVHHRPLSTAEQSAFSAQFSYGEKDYYLGNHPAWQLLRIAFRATRRPYGIGAVALLLGYAWGAVRRLERPVSPELMRFHRGEQVHKLGAILRSFLRREPVDRFNLGAEKARASATRQDSV